jgi:outer membrane protein assembly factor BamB
MKRSVLCLLILSALPLSAADWLAWRGPQQNGISEEKGLPDTWEPGGKNELWSVAVSGRGTPTIRGEKVYALTYAGEGPDLREYVRCYDAATGKELWQHAINDFLSDIIYRRYAIGSPTIDAETGNVYVLSSAGMFCGFSENGKLLFERSLSEEIGRMTFPNGRTGSITIHRNLLIFHAITSNWGAHGPAQDRFYAYDKHTGEPVWMSSPGMRPKDNSFSQPVITTWNKREVFYAGTGCGHVVCVDANTGEPLWRYGMSMGGVNSTILLDGTERIIAMHGRENIDNSDIGRMVAFNTQAKTTATTEGAPLLEKSAEIWRNTNISAFSSSPVLVGNRIYVTVETGDLFALDAATGKQLWKHKLCIEQLHASPTYADGKLYIPIKDHTFAIVRPSDEKPEILAQVDVQGECNGAVAIAHGRIYLLTTERLYCFGTVKPGKPDAYVAKPTSTQPAKKLIAVPAEVLLRPGEQQKIRLLAVDEYGIPTAAPTASPTWATFLPPTAKVKAEMKASFTTPDTLTAKPEQMPSAGMFMAKIDNVAGYVRGRIMTDLPLSENFDGFDVSVPSQLDPALKFAYPPLPWIGARFKWEVHLLDGNKVLAKTVENKLFQRAITFIGTPEKKDYTIQADVMSDGNRRKMSEVGVINQRYAVILKGNAQELEINSNLELIRVSVPYKWNAKTWYTIKSRVDVAADGSGIIRAKVWPKSEAEPDKWMLEVPHKNAHANGSPGLFGFSPTDMRVYIDNVLVTPNK